MNNKRKDITKSNVNIASKKSFDEKKFIYDLYVCETTKHILEERIEKLNYRLDDLGTDKRELWFPGFEKSSFRDEFNKEGQLSQKYPKKPTKPTKYQIHIEFGEMLSAFIGSTFVSVIIYLFLGFIVFGFFYEHNSDSSIHNIAQSVTTILTIIIPFVFTYVTCISDEIKKRSTYNKDVIKYEEAMLQYEKECKKIDENNAIIRKENTKLWNHKKRKYDEWVEKEKADYLIYSQQYDADVSTKRRIYEQELDVAQLKLSEVESMLKTLYSMRINGIVCIHPNYQGLVPVTVIYGYFDTGRCSSLRGYEGAYNLYEDERIKGIIINQLDDIKKELETLNATMTYVAIAIAGCEKQLDTLNRNMENLIAETSRMNSNFTETMHEMNSNMISYHQNMDDYAKQIEVNTANSAYYSEVGAKMSTLNTFYSIYKDL